MANLVFIHLGSSFPAHLVDSARQARLFDPDVPIYLAGDGHSLSKFVEAATFGIERVALEDLGLSDAHRRFRAVSMLDRTFRGGFWTFTTERFFVLERVSRSLGLADIIHIENDVMIYFAATSMAERFASQYPRLASTFDSDRRCVPGLIFARDADALQPLLDNVNRAVATPQSRDANDMTLISDYRRRHGPEFIAALPIVPPGYSAPLCSLTGEIPALPEVYSERVEVFGGIFDAAAIGQYVGGIDPRNAPGADTRGFINETCIFNPSLCRFAFAHDEKGRRRPTVSVGGKTTPIHNLHVHSKNLRPFAS